MVQNYNITLVTDSIILSPNFDVYIVEPTVSMTGTLPPIDHSGIHFKISRSDENNLLDFVLSATGTDTISTSFGGTGTILDILIKTYIELVSYNNSWVIVRNNNTDTRLSAALYATSFIANNNSPFFLVSGGTTTTIAEFPYDFINKPLFNNTSGSFTYISGNINGTLEISDFDGNFVFSISVVMSSDGIFNFTTDVFTGIRPNISTTILIKFKEITGGGSDKIGINSITIN